jgi:hypothetical protein
MLETFQAAPTLLDNLKPPRFETGKPFLVSGIAERCNDVQERTAGMRVKSKR